MLLGIRRLRGLFLSSLLGADRLVISLIWECVPLGYWRGGIGVQSRGLSCISELVAHICSLIYFEMFNLMYDHSLNELTTLSCVLRSVTLYATRVASSAYHLLDTFNLFEVSV